MSPPPPISCDRNGIRFGYISLIYFVELYNVYHGLDLVCQHYANWKIEIKFQSHWSTSLDIFVFDLSMLWDFVTGN